MVKYPTRDASRALLVTFFLYSKRSIAMIRIDVWKTLAATALVAATALGTTPLALGHQEGGYGWGPGMMGPGMGMGPGMMGGGMMGGYGPGMGMGMMGHGMMGGYGPGIMGYGPLGMLNLTEDQRKKLEAIQEEVRRKQWDLMGRMMEERQKLASLLWADKRDNKAIQEQYKKLQDLRQQHLQLRLDAHDKIEGVLTKEQKEQLKRFGPWWAQDVE